MKKVLLKLTLAILTICFVVTIYCTFSTVAKADVLDFKSTETYQLLKSFIEENPERLATTQGEYNAKEWIKAKLLSYGFLNEELAEQEFSTTGFSHNLIATIDAPTTDQQIIIGAHYDATANSQGANDNASGVVALLQIAQIFHSQRNSLNFDIKIVFFGNEEEGLVGSSHYVQKMTTAEFSKTCLMINLDCIAGGENLYILTEEVVTNFQRAFVEGAKDMPAKLNNKPLGAGIFVDYDFYGYGYYQIAQNSDHTPFRLVNIPTAFFFSGYYGLNGYSETKNGEMLINSAYDSLENLENLGVSAINKIDTVTGCITNTILDSSNIQVFLNAKNELISRVWLDTMLISFVALALILIVTVLVVLYRRKIVKQSLLGTAEVKARTVFSSPDSEDIFSFDDDKKQKGEKDNSTDADDIFKY